MEYKADALIRAAKVKLLVLDVDGTLTDGHIYMGTEGEMMKAFSARDGMGITLLKKAGIETAIITGRRSKIVENRAAELKIDRVWQGCSDKREAWRELRDDMGITDAEIAYAGDDLNDLPVLLLAGLACCPADAQPEIKSMAHVVSSYNGGNGTVRDLAEFILKAQGKWQSLVDAYAGTTMVPEYRQ